MSKPYGLIIPGQQKKEAARPAKPPIKPSIFDESSESDDSANNAPQIRPKASVTGGPSVMERRVARRMQEKALAEDPTIFQYDELYDEMENKRDEAKLTKSKEPRKAKYINRLMEHAERRKLEKELRVERQVQKDREAEGEMYKDKDTYVTAAYRKRLEYVRELQEKEQRADYLEAIGDVTKQKDLDGFYRHLYEQKLGTADTMVKPKTAPSTEEVAYKPIKADVPKHRSYRKRRASEDEEQQQPPAASPAKPTSVPDPTEDKPGSATNSQAHLNNNIDADSDFSIDDSTEDEVEDEKEKNMKLAQAKKQKQTKKLDQDQDQDRDRDQDQGNKSEQSKSPDHAKKKEKQKKKMEPAENPDTSKEATADPKYKSKDDDGQDTDLKNLPIPTVTKPTVDRTLIWRKRTVGEVFEAALARYQVRKKSRQG
ncbi:nuclear speckle splicing regulatory protein 1 [Drosophila persimilis]|uniref:nuclear speckle splicing regulatory protein 1 n=1 Tax=Drosophila persimilis TaxID=7234 RepID=UPI000F088907|nr:nuclear speckle splicing regulatory protein 1 [Drosophila persimilis]